MDCSLPGFSVHGISQARILEWVAISSSRGCFLNPGIKPRSLALQAVSCIAGGFFPTEQLREPITVCQSVSQSVQSLSHVQLFATLWTTARQASCPSPTPGVHPNPCALRRSCHPTISSSVVPFSCPQSFPVSGSFPMSQLFASGGQSIRVSASTSVLPMNTQYWSLLGWTSWISLQCKALSRVFSNTTVQSINSSAFSFLYSPTLTSIHDHWKNHSLD